MKILKDRLTMALSAALMLMLSACADDSIMIEQEDDGLATLTLNVACNSWTEGLGTTRGVAANLDFDIYDLTVVFYPVTANEEVPSTTATPALVTRYTLDDYTTHLEPRNSDVEPSTRHITDLSIENVALGTYRIYALANIGHLLPAQTEYKDGEIETKGIDLMTEKELCEYPIEFIERGGSGWTNPRAYYIPDAMFGYFHKADDTKEHSDEAKNEMGTWKQDVIFHNSDYWKWSDRCVGFNEDSKKGLYYAVECKDDENNQNIKNRKFDLSPKAITINKSITVHAWLKRTVSRLTIGYDGSQLRDGVEIYVKSARIMHAANSCHLGYDNKVTKDDQDPFTYSSEDERLNIVYSTVTGVEDGMAITCTTPAFPRSASTTQTKNGNAWNSVWYDEVHGNATTLSPSADYITVPKALYFMENLQGKVTDYSENQFKAGEYPKSFHKSINDEIDWTKHYDGKDYGTYVEVETYYVNTHKGTHGTMKYRFMLGLNATDDFNVERNRHYKLTLSFKGDANEADWHIDYVGDYIENIVSKPADWVTDEWEYIYQY